MAAENSTHVVVSAAFQDAGDLTRAIALAAALQEHCPADHSLKISFLSCGSRFEYLITDAGFPIIRCEPHVKGISVCDDLGWDFPEFFGSPEIAKTFIDGHMAALKEIRPDIVLHGMWAPVSLSARMLGIRTIGFLPVPLHPGSFANGLIRDLPDMLPLFTRLPRSMRQVMAKYCSGLMVHAPIFRQHRLGAAAAQCGWPIKGPMSLFDISKADLNLVNDLPEFHADYAHRLPANIAITGPLFAENAMFKGRTLDDDIAAHLKRSNGPSILVTMGSSGTPEFVFEAIKALKMSPDDNWNAVVLASPSICSIEEAKAIAAGDPRLLVTDRFIPAPAANALADAVIIHGGQGTVQTAIAAGTPIVGVALQVEQQTNLDNVMDAGAGIRIQRQNWKPAAIRNAVKTVLKDPSYTANAKMLAEKVHRLDGKKVAADIMWKFITETGPGGEKI